MDNLVSLLILIGVLWAGGVLFVATGMAILKAVQILEGNFDD